VGIVSKLDRDFRRKTDYGYVQLLASLIAVSQIVVDRLAEGIFQLFDSSPLKSDHIFDVYHITPPQL